MSVFALDPFFKEVERYVETGDGWAHLDVPLWKAEQQALRAVEPRRKADAMLLVVRFAERMDKRSQARNLANRASYCLERLDANALEARIEKALELFVRIGAVDAANDLVPYIRDPRRRAQVVMMDVRVPTKSSIVPRGSMA